MPLEITLMPGERFGRLTAVERIDKKGRGQYWRFRCDCGISQAFH